MTPKVTVIGAGFVGSTTALRIAERGLADVCLIDVVPGRPQALALDISHSAWIQRFENRVVGANDYKPARNSHVVVVTAGAARGPGMSRLDLLEKNRSIVVDACRKAAESSPDAVLLMVTNPLDEMTHAAAEATGFSREKVMGMAGLLDSSRMCSYIARALKVSPLAVDAMALGAHGQDMVPLISTAKVDGRPLAELANESTLGAIYEQTINAGAEIVQMLGTGSAYFAPSAAASKMVNAVIADTKEVLPASAWTTGQYGVENVFLGVPARLGRKGVEEIVEYELAPAELAGLRAAAEAIRARCASL